MVAEFVVQDHPGMPAEHPKSFNYEGRHFQVIQQVITDPVWDISIQFPVRKFLGRIEYSEHRGGWFVCKVGRCPYVDQSPKPTCRDAVLHLYELCNNIQKGAVYSWGVILQKRRSEKTHLIVVSTKTPDISDVWKAIQEALTTRPDLANYEFSAHKNCNVYAIQAQTEPGF